MTCITQTTETLLKKIKEDLSNWEDIPCSRIRKFNIVKMILAK